jgi:hypothetical protein
MNRTQHPSNNAVLGAPDGWIQDELPCGALPITRTEVHGLPCIGSFWRPTSDELAQLNAGALVAVWVIGNTTPPMSIEVAT